MPKYHMTITKYNVNNYDRLGKLPGNSIQNKLAIIQDVL